MLGKCWQLVGFSTRPHWNHISLVRSGCQFFKYRSGCGEVRLHAKKTVLNLTTLTLLIHQLVAYSLDSKIMMAAEDLMESMGTMCENGRLTCGGNINGRSRSKSTCKDIVCPQCAFWHRLLPKCTLLVVR
jgi:hypothetical protein